MAGRARCPCCCCDSRTVHARMYVTHVYVRRPTLVGQRGSRRWFCVPWDLVTLLPTCCLLVLASFRRRDVFIHFVALETARPARLRGSAAPRPGRVLEGLSRRFLVSGGAPFSWCCSRCRVWPRHPLPVSVFVTRVFVCAHGWLLQSVWVGDAPPPGVHVCAGHLFVFLLGAPLGMGLRGARTNYRRRRVGKRYSVS